MFLFPHPFSDQYAREPKENAVSVPSAESQTMFSGLVCVGCGVGATILALLGTNAWPLLVVLAALALHLTLYHERSNDKHRWAIHQGIDIIMLVSFLTGALGLAVATAFLVFGSPVGFVWALVANGILVVFGLFLALLLYPDALDVGPS